jgi:hypothetical protein
VGRFVGTRVKQRSVLWGVLAALAIGAGALVVAVGGGGEGDGDGSPPLLPLAAGGDGAGDARAESVADAPAIALASVYVPGDDLPELGGEAPAYRLIGEVSADDVVALADALGIDAEPTETGDSGGGARSWHVEDGEMALDVYGPDGSWSAYRMVAAGAVDPAAATGTVSGGGSSGSTGVAAPRRLSGGQALPGQICPGTEPGADNVVDLCDQPVCPSGPAADPPLGCEPICLDQPDVATDAPRCEPPTCPQYAPGGESPALEPDDPCVSPPCPGNAADTRCPTPTPTIAPDPAPTDPSDPADPTPVEPQPGPVPSTTVPPPVDLPSEGEARATALDLLEATGADVDGVEVTAENLVSMWSITVEPSVDGRAAPGLAMYVAIGDGGQVDSASGRLTSPDELGDYPLIDTRAAITRLNEGWGFAATARDVTSAAAAESSASATASGTESPSGDGSEMILDPVPPPTGGDPDQPVSNEPGGDLPVDQPIQGPAEVEVTDAEIVLVTAPSWDESGTYLVPGYRFTAADDSRPTVPAVTDDVLEPPPSAEPAGEPQAEPEPMPLPATEPGDPGAPDARVAVALYHCGFEELRHGDRRWVVEDPPFDGTNAPLEFTGKGSFALNSDGETAVYTDDSGIAVTFTAVGEDWEFPLCE